MEFINKLVGLFQGDSLVDNLVGDLGNVIGNFVEEETSFLDTLQNLDFTQFNGIIDSISKFFGA